MGQVYAKVYKHKWSSTLQAQKYGTLAGDD